MTRSATDGAIAAVRAVCRRAHRIVGVHLAAHDAARWAGKGLDLVTANADVRHLGTALSTPLTSARGA